MQIWSFCIVRAVMFVYKSECVHLCVYSPSQDHFTAKELRQQTAGHCFPLTTSWENRGWPDWLRSSEKRRNELICLLNEWIDSSHSNTQKRNWWNWANERGVPRNRCQRYLIGAEEERRRSSGRRKRPEIDGTGKSVKYKSHFIKLQD